MKYFILGALVALVAVSSVAADCSWGESYWCSNLKIATKCGAVKHCMTTVWKNQILPKDSNDVCQFCESLIKDVDQMVRSKASEAKIEQYMDSACAIIPDASIAAQCKDLVKNYLPQILQLVVSELDPQKVCAAIGLCTGFQDRVHHPASKPVHKHVMPKYYINIKKVAKMSEQPICTDCKKFMGDIQAMITSNTTEQEVEQYLDNILCAQLGPLEATCKDLIAQYGAEVFQLLSSQFNPAQICGALGFCSALLDHTMLYRMKLQKSPLYLEASKLSGSAECTVCEVLMGELQALDRNPKVQADVETFFKTELCAKLGSLKAVCDATVDQYAPILFEFLVSELDPATRCRSFGFCSSAVRKATPDAKVQKMTQKAAKKGVSAGPQCILCEFVMKEIDNLLGQNKTQAQIEAALNKVCSLLPETIKQECTSFVTQYGPAIINLLLQELQPQQVCTFLGLCSKTTLQTAPKSTGEMCGICETVIQYIDSLLSENATIQEIENVLEKVCNFLPDNIKQECDGIIKTYGPAIVQMIVKLADPHAVCTEIKLCTAKVAVPKKLVYGRVQLLGDSKCTYGPAYWCASQKNAEECKAVAHCKKHVWKN